MLTGDIRSQINAIWDSFWSGGISNPLEVMEQITYLLFLRRLDDLHTLEENKSTRLKHPMERRIFPEGSDDHPRTPLIKGMPISLPPLELQIDFARQIAAVEKLKTAHRAALAELDALFASLHHRAFRGEL